MCYDFYSSSEGLERRWQRPEAVMNIRSIRVIDVPVFILLCLIIIIILSSIGKEFP